MALHAEVKRQKVEETEDDNDNADHPDVAQDAYLCLSCLQEVKTEILYHGVQLMSDSFFNYLLNSINDTTAEQHMQVMGKVVVPVQVDCEHCREEIEVKAGITATPVWDKVDDDTSESNEVSNSNVVRISHFQDIKVVDILPPDTTQDASLQSCFYNESEDIEPEWPSFVISDFERNQRIFPDATNQKTLIIVAKMPSQVGLSYIGYDVVEKRLLRLVFQLDEEKFSLLTSENLGIGERYKLTMLRHPKYQKTAPAPTLYPHRNDDLVVHKDLRYLPYPQPVDLFELLEPHSHCTIKEIFSPGHIYKRKYIWVNRNCPSLGVLLCKDFNVQLYTDDSGTRRIKIFLNDCWDIPVTGFDCEKAKDRGRDILLALSLSSSWDNDGLYKPARCYIMCVGIITKQMK